jgi:hypothetical protein
MAGRRGWAIAVGLTPIAIVIIVAIAALVLKIPSGPTVPAGPAVYTQQQFDYFRDIAFEPPEYGNSSSVIYRCDGDLRINIAGEPEYSDIDAVLSAMEELKGLTGNISLSLIDSNANVIVYVGNEGPIPDYLETNDTTYAHGGFFFWTHDDTFNINRSVIAISSDYYSATVRANNLRYGLAPTFWDCTAYHRCTRIASSTRITRRSIIIRNWTGRSSGCSTMTGWKQACLKMRP